MALLLTVERKMGDIPERDSRQRKERGAARGLIGAKMKAVLLAAKNHRTRVRAGVRENAAFAAK
jgi:hypothetical protein